MVAGTGHWDKSLGQGRVGGHWDRSLGQVTGVGRSRWSLGQVTGTGQSRWSLGQVTGTGRSRWSLGQVTGTGHRDRSQTTGQSRWFWNRPERQYGVGGSRTGHSTNTKTQLRVTRVYTLQETVPGSNDRNTDRTGDNRDSAAPQLSRRTVLEAVRRRA